MPKEINPRLLKSAVFAANDGIITTFAVVAGVSGAQLAAKIVMILGVSNLIADGLSMALGDYLGERSEARLRIKQKQSKLPEKLWHTSLITFISFALAGTLPLLPYFIKFFSLPVLFDDQFYCSILTTSLALFLVGSLRTLAIKGNWLKNGLEMLSVGSIAAIVAYLLGAGVEKLIN